MRADLLFNVKDAEVDTAIVAFEQPIDTQWPLDVLNEALFHFYDVNDARPWIFTAIDDGLPVGYVVAERDDHVTQRNVLDAFYGMLSEQGLWNAEWPGFTRPVPFAASGQWDGVTVGIAVHPQRYGPSIPVEPINTALWKILGQTTWGGAQLWLYPVRKGSQGAYSGLLIQTKVDDLADNALVDDAMFKKVAEQNDRKQELVERGEFKAQRFDLS